MSQGGACQAPGAATCKEGNGARPGNVSKAGQGAQGLQGLGRACGWSNHEQGLRPGVGTVDGALRQQPEDGSENMQGGQTVDAKSSRASVEEVAAEGSSEESCEESQHQDDEAGQA